MTVDHPAAVSRFPEWRTYLGDETGVVEGRVRRPVKKDRTRRDLHRQLARFAAEQRYLGVQLEPEHGSERSRHPVEVSEPEGRREHPGEVATPDRGVPRIPGDQPREPLPGRGVQPAEGRPSKPVRPFEPRVIRETQDRSTLFPGAVRRVDCPRGGVRVRQDGVGDVRWAEVPFESAREQKGDRRGPPGATVSSWWDATCSTGPWNRPPAQAARFRNMWEGLVLERKSRANPRCRTVSPRGEASTWNAVGRIPSTSTGSRYGSNVLTTSSDAGGPSAIDTDRVRIAPEGEGTATTSWTTPNRPSRWRLRQRPGAFSTPVRQSGRAVAPEPVARERRHGPESRISWP